MRKCKKAIALLFMLSAGVVAAALVCSFITVLQLPDELIVHESGSSRLSTLLPVSVECSGDSSDSAQAKLFGVVGVKNVAIRRENTKKVMLAGTLFGLRMYSDGVMVVGISDFDSCGRRVNPAKDSGVRQGDIIRSVGGRSVYTNSDFAEAVKKSRGTLTLELTDRDGKRRSVKLTPVRSDADGCLRTGLWVRDSAAGIGTLTYIDPESGSFGGLGHGICDADTHEIIPIQDGEIVSARVGGVRRGVRGCAGEIVGYLGGSELGVLESNTARGAFGRYTAELPEFTEYEAAVKQETKQGRAKILCTVTNDCVPRLYDIEIENIKYGGEPTKNMIIRVTDERLLSQTGGIIQGMSGSPIIQGGKFVGAVTHVFVNDPKRGYAIFAENMLNRPDEE